MTALVSRIVWGLGSALLLWIVLGAFLRRRRRRAATERFHRDARDPFRQWVQAAFRIVSGDVDYADLPSVEARRILARWWHVHGPRELELALADLGAATSAEPSWDLIRYFVVTRLGVAAGWLDREEAWSLAKPVARRLQSSYDGWPALGHAYVVARRHWQGLAHDGSEDDAGMHAILDNIARLRDGPWAEIPFHRRFRDDEPPA